MYENELAASAVFCTHWKLKKLASGLFFQSNVKVTANEIVNAKHVIIVRIAADHTISKVRSFLNKVSTLIANLLFAGAKFLFFLVLELIVIYFSVC